MTQSSSSYAKLIKEVNLPMVQKTFKERRSKTLVLVASPTAGFEVKDGSSAHIHLWGFGCCK